MWAVTVTDVVTFCLKYFKLNVIGFWLNTSLKPSDAQERAMKLPKVFDFQALQEH